LDDFDERDNTLTRSTARKATTKASVKTKYSSSQ